MTKETGGSAFPIAQQRNEFSGDIETHFEAGMTLRDWFAGMALQGILSRGRATIGEMLTETPNVADAAYELADAMIEARKS